MKIFDPKLTGSIEFQSPVVGAGVTSSLFGTASWAINAVNAAANPPFPYTGSAVISGSLTVTGSLRAANITGSLLGTASYALQTLSSSYSQTSSYGVNITISGSITNADYIQFNTTSSVTDTVGRLYFDQGEGVLQYALNGNNTIARIGEDLYQYAYNAEASPMTKGQVVYISGSQGNRIAVKLASNNAEQGSSNVLGFVAESIAAGADGWVQTNGVIRKLNTTGLTAGKLIFLSSTPGAYTQSFPQAPSHSVRLGFPERIDATVGSIYIKIDNGYETDELHDVAITSASSGDLLVRTGSIWVNSKQLTGSYGLTGSLTAIEGGFTGSFYGTASWANNAVTASYVTGSIHTSANPALSASYALSSSNSVTASYALNGGVTQIIAGTNISLSPTNGLGAVTITSTGGSGNAFPYTGSAQITGSLGVTGSFSVSGSGINSLDSTQITGSLDVTGSLRVVGNASISGSLTIQQNLIVQGTSSIEYVTSSQLNISTNLITVNTQNPSFRFGGLAAIDSGSSPQQSGSLLYDSVQDEWIFVHRGSATAPVTSSHIMMGPETYGTLGDETYIPATKLVKSVGNEHLTGSNVHDDGTTVVINSNTQITGSLILSASSNVSELTVLGQAVITGSLIVSGSGGYGIFSKGITLADLTNGFNVTGSYYVWRAPYPATVVGVWAIKSGSSSVSVNARRSGSGAALHLASNLTITANNLWSSGGTVQNTTYSAGDSLEIIFSGSNIFQSSVQVDYIKR